MHTDLAPIMIHHPASLSEDELHRLMAWARQIGHDAPATARWVGNYAAYELQRRTRGEVEEPATLDLIPGEWYTGEAAQGVAALVKVIAAAERDGKIYEVLVGSAVAMSLLIRDRTERE